ncbi:MAG: hypothetical protein UT24_C0037G0020 [Candidatus Woesebacteria bacterium GW2011_GWB1_39_12]|uniref:Uncharacterized protein n=1 Tax=Candidatus Woesebacteria bacterium GW2011_GWB1_39_12 TaxID=1618574 RepID=A0A0G0QAG6_9BACT|nr:MAG: hypothetical protein UT24_C0037G0020 [Candidatus Woesebacteria bacterium GW2011_GWB1_39_12]
MKGQDYLNKLSYCRDLNKMALLIRAEGCRTITAIQYVTPHWNLIEALTRYELDAQFVERNCVTIKDAKNYLKMKGYF